MAKVGDKIKMCDEKQRYTVQAINDRFAILTKPFNLQRTYSYTIADRKRGQRGAIGLIFGLNNDVNTPTGAGALLADLMTGAVSVSRRNCVDLYDAEIAALGWAAAGPLSS